MKNLVLLFVFALCIYIFAGCNRTPKDTDEETRKIVVFFSAKSDANSLLKSTASDNEKKITKVALFGVDALNNVIENYTPIDNPPSTGTSLVISNNVNMLYAIANPSDVMVAKTPSNLSDILAMTGTFADAPQSPFLMGGKGDVSNYAVNIEFIRAVAKISFIGKNEFVIESVTVGNTPDHGYIFSQALPVVPLSAARVSYPKVESSTPMVYVAENTKQDPTQFVVTGKFNSKQATYAFVLVDRGTKVDIARNTHYQVNISPKTDSECTITIDIPDWGDGDTDDIEIPDEKFE